MSFFFDVLKQTGNFPKGLPFLPVFVTIFFLVLTLNIVGLLPFGFTVTSHIIVTFFLALAFNLSFFILGFQKHVLIFF
jgi:F-type H+-transporting ATPase subunit a